jgi:excisionase family DNA binding protein
VTERLVYTVPEVSELLGCGTSTVYDAVSRGELPGVLRLGRRIFVSRAALHAVLGLTGAAPDLPQENGAAGNGAANERKTLDDHREHRPLGSR